MGRSAWIRDRIDAELMVPAVGQGALGIACRAGEQVLRARLRAVLQDGPTEAATRAERAFLRTVGGGCQVPLGAWARVEDETLVMDACIAALDGSEHYRDRRTCAPEEGEAMAIALAQDLLDAGGEAILSRILGDRSEQGSPFQP
jgi:hydroxymethylbilane synthase